MKILPAAITDLIEVEGYYEDDTYYLDESDYCLDPDFAKKKGLGRDDLFDLQLGYCFELIIEGIIQSNYSPVKGIKYSLKGSAKFSFKLEDDCQGDSYWVLENIVFFNPETIWKDSEPDNRMPYSKDIHYQYRDEYQETYENLLM